MARPVASTACRPSTVVGCRSNLPSTRTGGRYFKAYVLWLTLPPMLLLLLGQPITLILMYGVLGALFMPFLAITLVWLLNTDRTPAEWRNRWNHNLGLFVCTAFFIVLAVYQVHDTISD